MVKSGGFIAGVAAILDLPEPTISGAFRVLRVNGLMTTGARGVNAPEMADLDAARILIAMLVNERPAYSENSARDFGQLVCNDFQPATKSGNRIKDNFVSVSEHFTLEARGLPKRHTLEQAVAELIRMAGDDRDKDYWAQSRFQGAFGSYEPRIELEIVPSSLSARITMNGNEYDYYDPMVDLSEYDNLLNPTHESAMLIAQEAHDLKKSRYSTAIRSIRSVHTTQFLELAALIRHSGEDHDVEPE